jgi:peptidoglycan hydrolase CwlO-like protein
MTNTNYPSASTTPQAQPPKSRTNKNILIGILAAGLLGTWGYLLYDKNKSGEKIDTQQKEITTLGTEKSDLQRDFDNALARLDSVTGANNNLSGENADLKAQYAKDIDAKKAEIRRLLNKNNASAADLAKAKSMISELNEKITGLEADVARLTGENQELTAVNVSLKEEKTVLEQNLVTTTTEKEELSKTVDVASTFTASNIQVTPVDEKKSGKEKVQSTAKKVDKLVISFDVENRIARSGPADMYLIVTGPDGKVITDGASMLNTRTDGDKQFTSKVAIDYTQGQRKNIQFPIRNANSFSTGDYKVEVYHNGFKIGEGVRSLKKGGLFG